MVDISLEAKRVCASNWSCLRNRVLLLDFETWHCILNRWHLSLSWRESREWDRRIKGLDQFRGPLPEPFESELRATWDRVFEFDKTASDQTLGADRRDPGSDGIRPNGRGQARRGIRGQVDAH